MNKKYFTVIFLSLIVLVISGIISNDLIIGGTILLTGLLCAYFASEGKRINYIFGLINYLLMAYVAFKNNLFGIFFFYVFIFSPLQIEGFITWKKNLNDDKNVCVREFTLKNSCLITLTCLIGSIVVSVGSKNNEQLEYLGAIIYGNTDEVNEITGKFQLWKID